MLTLWPRQDPVAEPWPRFCDQLVGNRVVEDRCIGPIVVWLFTGLAEQRDAVQLLCRVVPHQVTDAGEPGGQRVCGERLACVVLLVGTEGGGDAELKRAP